MTGLLCQAGSGEDLYRAMKGFLALPPAARAAMGQAGRKKMEREFDKKTVVAQTLAALGLDG